MTGVKMKINLLISFGVLVSTLGEVEASRLSFDTTVYDQNPNGYVGSLNQVQDWLDGYTFNVGEKKVVVRCLAPNGDIEDLSGEPHELLPLLQGRTASTFLVAPFERGVNQFIQRRSSNAVGVREEVESVVEATEAQPSPLAQAAQEVLDWYPQPREKRALSADAPTVSQVTDGDLSSNRPSVRFEENQRRLVPGLDLTSTSVSHGSRRSALTQSTRSFQTNRSSNRERHDEDLRAQRGYIGSAGDHPFPVFRPQPIIKPERSLGDLLRGARSTTYSEEENSDQSSNQSSNQSSKQSSNRKGYKKPFDPYAEHDLNWSPREDAAFEDLSDEHDIFDKSAGSHASGERRSRRNSEQEHIYSESDSSSDSDSLAELHESRSKNSLYGKKSHQRKKK